MKLLFAVCAFCILSACGGGGGASAPPDTRSTSQIITDEDKRQAQVAAAELRQTAEGLPESERQEFLRQVAALESEINSNQRTIKFLLAQVENLRNRLDNLTQSQTKDCADGTQIPETGTCPPQMQTCPDGSRIPVADTCPPTTKDCPDGSRIPVADTCPPTMKDCPDGSQIPVADACPPTMKDCPDGSQIPIADTCPPTTKDCPDGSQIPIADACPPTTKDCPDGSRIPVADTCPPTMKDCPDGSQIPIADNCPPSPPESCTDFRVRNTNGECTYDTAEFRRNYGLGRINALYAYERGYFGQSVTVALVDSGTPRLDHENLIGQVVNSLYADRTHSTDNRPNNFHATATGGVIAALRNGISLHGVAPEAKLVSFLSGGVDKHRIQYFVDNTLNIISNQIGYPHPCHSGRIRGMRYSTKICPYIPQLSGVHIIDINARATVDWQPMENSDIVRVMGAGNSGWNGLNATIYLGLCDYQNPDDDVEYSDILGCSLSEGSPVLTLSIDELINEFVDERYGALSTLGISPLGCDLDCFLPQANPLLEDNWIVAVAVDRDDKIAFFSDVCGETKDWCVSAPGVGISVLHSGDVNGHTRLSGTSFAAPHVSGALAVLKSAANAEIATTVSMTAIRQILLETATPLGTVTNAMGERKMENGMPVLSSIYGWGLVNISAGIVSIQNMETAEGMAVRDLRRGLPGEFSHLRGRLSEVSVALQVTDRSYYNIALSDIVGGGDSDSPDAVLGKAAKAMQTNDYEAGESFRFWGGAEYDGGKSNYIGEGNSPFAAADTSDTGGYVRWTTAEYGGLSAFGEYGRTEIQAEYDSRSLISAMDGARAENWTMGFQYKNILRKGDNLQISARQESRISGGDILIRHSVAEGDPHKAFIGETPQTIRTETAKIPIKQKPATIWTLGYSGEINRWIPAFAGMTKGGFGITGGEWTAAAEWNENNGETGFSFAAEIGF